MNAKQTCARKIRNCLIHDSSSSRSAPNEKRDMIHSRQTKTWLKQFNWTPESKQRNSACGPLRLQESTGRRRDSRRRSWTTWSEPRDCCDRSTCLAYCDCVKKEFLNTPGCRCDVWQHWIGARDCERLVREKCGGGRCCSSKNLHDYGTLDDSTQSVKVPCSALSASSLEIRGQQQQTSDKQGVRRQNSIETSLDASVQTKCVMWIGLGMSEYFVWVKRLRKGYQCILFMWLYIAPPLNKTTFFYIWYVATSATLDCYFGGSVVTHREIDVCELQLAFLP